MIPAALIEDIRNKADIVSVISEYVNIRKRGKNYLGLCPFHSEKDPSFTVSPDKQMFHCFGCHEGGNVFSFLMKVEDLSFVEAVAELGNKLGVTVPTLTSKGDSKSHKDRLAQTILLASRFFQDSLKSDAGQAARAYLQARKISDQTSQLFGLGCAPVGWDNLFQYLISRGVAPALVEEAGLILTREGQSGYYDRFRQRLIFPIADPRGRVVAFGGRSLGNEEPKYLNSPDTPIYHKGDTLFGLSFSKDAIKAAKTAILVEGNFDLITPFQAGYTNIVATMGTAMTVAQAKLLTRYCATVIIAYDADAAGGLAAERAMALLRAQGLQVKVANLQGGKDPDELISRLGSSTFSHCLAAALPYWEFKIRQILGRHNLAEIEPKAKALQEIARALSQEADRFVQKEYAKLAAALLKIEAESLTAEMRRHQHYQQADPISLRRVTTKPSSSIVEAEKNLIALATQDDAALAALKQQLNLADFSLPETRAIAELIFTTQLQDHNQLPHFLLNNLPDESARKLLSKLVLCDHLSLVEHKEKIVNDCLEVLKGQHAKNKIIALKAELKVAEQAGETAKAEALLSALQSEIS